MNLRPLACVAAAGALMLAGCLVEDDPLGNDVFSCDATGTVAEMCIEEGASPDVQQESKNTCKEIKGTWSDGGKCPSSYKKRCKDGSKWNYYYASDDADKTCEELGAIGILLSSAP